jgi:hypothetical protein
MRLLLAMLGLLLLGGVVVAMEVPELLQRWVIAAGGGRVTSAGYRLNSTIGQAVVGDTGSHGYRLKAGYWPGPGEGPTPGTTPTRTLTPVPGLTQRLTLPIITRNVWSP